MRQRGKLPVIDNGTVLFVMDYNAFSFLINDGGNVKKKTGIICELLLATVHT